MSGYETNKKVRENAICSGNVDIFHLCGTTITNINCGARYEDFDIVEYLVNNGADASIKDEAGNSPLENSISSPYINYIVRITNKYEKNEGIINV